MAQILNDIATLCHFFLSIILFIYFIYLFILFIILLISINSFNCGYSLIDYTLTTDNL